jgi:GxxExxY protein
MGEERILNHGEHNDHGDIVSHGLTAGDPENLIAEKVLDSAFKIHRMYGAVLLESAYEHLLVHELSKNQGLSVEAQKTLPLIHEGFKIDAGYRLDLLVADRVIIELKCVEKVLPVHEAQLLTYLQLSGKRLGLLLNFRTKMLKDGVKRFVL